MTTPVTLTDAERETLQQRLDTIEAAQEKIADAMKPLRTADQALQEVYDSLTGHLPDIQGKCESCNRLLFEGEQGFRYTDGPILCAEHAPTWADIRSETQEVAEAADGDTVDDDALADRTAVLAQCAEREAAGTLNDKCLHTL